MNGKWWTNADGSMVIVGTKSQAGLEYGRLVNLGEATAAPGPEVPVGSIAGWLPYEDFSEGRGPVPKGAAVVMGVS